MQKSVLWNYDVGKRIQYMIEAHELGQAALGHPALLQAIDEPSCVDCHPLITLHDSQHLTRWTRLMRLMHNVAI